MTSPTDTRPPNGLMVLHGNRLEDLRDLLVDYLRVHPLAPLQPEVILLQSNGMKHWLELARQLPVADASSGAGHAGGAGPHAI